MAYQYKGKQTIEQDLADAQAELEARRVASVEAREQLRKLKATKRRAEELAAQQAAAEREIYRLTHGAELPPPRYGGRQGLAAAAREASGWWAKKHQNA